MNKIKFLFSTVAIAFVFLLVFFLTYNLVEPKAYDFMVKAVSTQKLLFDNFKKVHGSDDVVIIVIDSKTTQKYRWPWKRDMSCKIFKYLHEYAQPKAIADDAILTTLDINYPDADKRYFDTIKQIDNLTTGFMPLMKPWENAEFGAKYQSSFAKKYGILLDDNSAQTYPPYWSMLTSPQAYLDAVQNMGHVYVPVGQLNKNISSWAFDNIIRTNEYILKYSDAYFPSLALKTYLLINPDTEIVVKNKNIILTNSKQKINIGLLNKAHVYSGLKRISVQTYSNPIKFYKQYNSGYSHKHYSAVDIMDSYDAIRAGRKPIINPAELKDKIVVVGANVPASAGLNDNKNSSIAVNHPGVDLQATVIDNLVNNDFMRVVPVWVNVIITLFGMLFVYAIIRINDLFKSICIVSGLIAFYLLISAGLFDISISINVITPIVMFILTMIVAFTHKFILENRSKEKVKSAMGKYMSQDVMKRVVQNIDNLGLGGKKSIVTVLFADIRGFTSMSEQMTAQQVSEFLNEYFTEMEPIITKYNGVINKFIGDAVMAIFGEPIQDKNHAENAVRCAHAMLEKVKELQRKWISEGKPKLEIGVGVNTGEVFVGNIGSINRMEYTVIGDTVNLASRLESYNKVYKTKLLISSTTYEEVKGFAEVIKISDVQIRGKANKMDIYEVLNVN